MKQKKLQKSFILFLSFCIVFQVFLTIKSVVKAEEGEQRVYDEAGLLKDSEIEEIEKRAIKAEDKIETELYIVTTEDTKGQTSEEYAENFGRENRFGYQRQEGSYIIFLIDMQNRMIWISTSGRAKAELGEREVDDILDEIYIDISKGDYYQSCLSYLKMSEKYLKNTNVLSNPLVCLAIAASVGGIVTGVLYSQASSKMTAQARDYQVQGEFRVNQKSDLYVRTTVKSRKIETESKNIQKQAERKEGGNGGGGRHF